MRGMAVPKIDHMKHWKQSIMAMPIWFLKKTSPTRRTEQEIEMNHLQVSRAAKEIQENNMEYIIDSIL